MPPDKGIHRLHHVLLFGRAAAGSGPGAARHLTARAAAGERWLRPLARRGDILGSPEAHRQRRHPERAALDIDALLRPDHGSASSADCPASLIFTDQQQVLDRRTLMDRPTSRS